MLGEFLRDRMGDPGAWHCSTLAADWCRALGHPDFAAEWRSVSDPAECERLPAEAGGLVNLWDRGIGDALPVVEQPQAGDIAVVGVLGNAAGAIFTGQRWAIQAARGLHFIGVDQIEALKVWRP